MRGAHALQFIVHQSQRHVPPNFDIALDAAQLRCSAMLQPACAHAGPGNAQRRMHQIGHRMDERRRRPVMLERLAAHHPPVSYQRGIGAPMRQGGKARERIGHGIRLAAASAALLEKLL